MTAVKLLFRIYLLSIVAVLSWWLNMVQAAFGQVTVAFPGFSMLGLLNNLFEDYYCNMRALRLISHSDTKEVSMVSAIILTIAISVVMTWIKMCIIITDTQFQSWGRPPPTGGSHGGKRPLLVVKGFVCRCRGKVMLERTV